MFLKRSMVLAAGLFLFILGFIIYFHVNESRMEEGFRQERLKFGVEGTVLTAPEKPASASGNTSPSPNSSSAPATGSLPDTNVIIGPVPPPSSSTPDSTPAPSTPDTNAAPTPTPSSTMLRPGTGHLPWWLSAMAYTSVTPTPQVTPTPSPSPTVTPTIKPSTNTAPANATNNASTSVPTTNGAPFAISGGDSGAPRPVPVEASVIVLGYHQFSAAGQPSKNVYSMTQDVFEQEMKYLKDNGYHVVPLSDVVRFVKHEIGLPPNAVAITIDDGYKSAIVYAAPILKKYGFPWTFFVYPEFITVTESKGAASWPDLLALQADGVDIESHTMTHPFLTHKMQKFKGKFQALSPEEYDEFLTNETSGSKTLLEQKLGKPVSYLAYPFGDFNKAVEAKAIAAGYDGIFTVADNPVHSTTNKYSIGRYIITKPVERMFVSYLRQGALSIAGADPAPGTTISNPRPVITAVLGYEGNLDPKSIETDVRDYGAVHHDFDPKTSTVRLYLPRDLIQAVNVVNIRVKDAESGQTMVANWHFNYEPAGAAAAATHEPIAASSTNAPPAGETTEPTSPPTPQKAASPSPVAKVSPF